MKLIGGTYGNHRIQTGCNDSRNDAGQDTYKQTDANCESDNIEWNKYLKTKYA